MTKMGIDPLYPKMNLSKRMQQVKVCPYLLRNAVIDRPNQAWSIDITYIPIKHGFLYLTAIIDWYSRCIIGWEVDDTLDTRRVINALKKAFKASQILSTHLLIMEVDFCPVLCIPEVPVLQAFRGISHFVWYCKAVSDLS